MFNFNYNDTIKFNDYDGSVGTGVIKEVSSDMDSYEVMKLKDGVAMYYSKKTGTWKPVKEKTKASVFLTVMTGENSYKKSNYVLFEEVIEVVLEEAKVA